MPSVSSGIHYTPQPARDPSQVTAKNHTDNTVRIDNAAGVNVQDFRQDLKGAIAAASDDKVYVQFGNNPEVRAMSKQEAHNFLSDIDRQVTEGFYTNTPFKLADVKIDNHFGKQELRLETAQTRPMVKDVNDYINQTYTAGAQGSITNALTTTTPAALFDPLAALQTTIKTTGADGTEQTIFNSDPQAGPIMNTGNYATDMKCKRAACLTHQLNTPGNGVEAFNAALSRGMNTGGFQSVGDQNGNHRALRFDDGTVLSYNRSEAYASIQTPDGQITVIDSAYLENHKQAFDQMMGSLPMIPEGTATPRRFEMLNGSWQDRTR